MEDSGCLVFLALVVVIAGAWYLYQERKLAKMSPDEHAAHVAQQKRTQADLTWGPRNPQLVCPHCQTRGEVRIKSKKVKKGVSGGKATAALITLGTSVLVTGLSRKEGVTQAYCEKCGSTWRF